MAIRQSIRGLSRDPQQLALLRRAFARMKSLTDDRGYDFFAAIHGLSLPVWCEHGTSLFLPWHRAYLYYFELALQSRLGQRFTIVEPRDPELGDVGIPWWDWTSQESHAGGIPPAYADATADGAANPLFDAEIGSCTGGQPLATGVWSAGLMQSFRQGRPGAIGDDDPPRTLRDPDPPGELPTAADVDAALAEGTFANFSSSLENVHNGVHVWVGGAMSMVPTAAYDPIFWSHHSMIDRIWYLWQLSENGIDPPAALRSVVLAPFPMTVADTLDIADLRYDYAVQAIG